MIWLTLSIRIIVLIRADLSIFGLLIYSASFSLVHFYSFTQWHGWLNLCQQFWGQLLQDCWVHTTCKFDNNIFKLLENGNCFFFKWPKIHSKGRAENAVHLFSCNLNLILLLLDFPEESLFFPDLLCRMILWIWSMESFFRTTTGLGLFSKSCTKPSLSSLTLGWPHIWLSVDPPPSLSRLIWGGGGIKEVRKVLHSTLSIFFIQLWTEKQE